MGQSVFELDTKGICVMCLRRCDPGGGDGGGGEGQGERNRRQSLQSFKLLMRYLNIDVLQKCCNFPPSFLQSFGGGGEYVEKKEIDMGVKLCGVCQDICEEFSDIYMKFEMIRLQLDECVQALYQMMQGGDKDKGRKRGWEKRIFGGDGGGGGSGSGCNGQSWNPLQLFHASIADNLRKETLRKCELRVKTAVPRVTIPKSAVPVQPNTSSPPTPPVIPSSTPPTCMLEMEENSCASLKVEAIYSPSPPIVQEDHNHDHLNDNHSHSHLTNDPLANDDDHQTTPRDSFNKEFITSPSNSCYCRSCNKSYASKESLRIHFNAVHTFEAFFHQLPEGTTEDQLKIAVIHCVQQYKKFQNPGDPAKNRPCSFCGKNYRDVFFLKLHILDNHFNQVLEALKNPLYSSGAKFGPKLVAKKRTGWGEGGGGGVTSQEGGSTSSAVPVPRYLTSTGRAGSKLRGGYTGPVFSCPICQKVFTVKACMKRHFKTFHTKEGTNRLKGGSLGEVDVEVVGYDENSGGVQMEFHYEGEMENGGEVEGMGRRKMMR